MPLLAALVCVAGVCAQQPTNGPVHRYNFTNTGGALADGTVVVDSVGGSNGVIRGKGATADGTGIRLTGGSSATAPYIELPGGIASGKDRSARGYSNATYEVWMTMHSDQNWSRAFDFGVGTAGEIKTPGGAFSGTNYFMVSVNEGAAPNVKMERVPGGFQSVPRATATGARVHLAATYDTSDGTWNLYKNGIRQSSFATPNGPGSIHDVNVWLGRSNFSGDSNSDATFSEFRIYDYALSRQQVWDSFGAGPQELGAIGFAKSTPVPKEVAPTVQMLVPGFTVRELPVRLTALNNVEYAPDGRLFAGGYDGRFHLLRDLDGDGLEEKADTFSPETSDDYPLGMVVKDGMPHALLANELVRFRDTDGDGIPDKREMVASGWDDPLLSTNSLILHRRVDSAMALASGPDGSWYITMGSANPGNGYWQDATKQSWDPNAPKAGQPKYSTNVLRGCLLKIDRDGKVTRLNSGLRYIMSLQRNEHGDFFGTDQEGATWLPNGNPFDELLHLQEGRHYGFPPRHPKLLPGVIDEPSVWDFAPQHQSVCGFRFNGPKSGVGRFGPAEWANNAILTGASRGKLWRTKLVKTTAGYVAQTELIAVLGMIAVDCAISPKGDLVVACHAGPPDWGSGPAALGRIFKIRYAGGPPQPVATWAESETETRVEFDKPLQAVPKDIGIEYGRNVSAADRLEPFRPGYAVVNMQQKEPRTSQPVESVRLVENGTQLAIRSAARTEAVNYALSFSSPELGDANVDLAYMPTGVAFDWLGASGKTAGILPHLDFSVVRGFATGRHKRFLTALNSPGELKMRCRLAIENMLHPAVQPGSKLDYEPNAEVITLVFDSDADFTVAGNGGTPTAWRRHQELTVTNGGGAFVPVEIALKTPASRFDLAFFTAEDSRTRPLGMKRILAPFATPPRSLAGGREAVETAGGNWTNGKALFFGKAACATCHQIRNEGHVVGPDLSNLIHRDYASVLRDIREPDATINPDAVAYTIKLRDGTEVIGVRSSETDSQLNMVAGGGVVTTLNKADITSREANTSSLMPTGLLDGFTAGELKDLMTFLLTEGSRK